MINSVDETQHPHALKEKNYAATSSVVAAVFLAVFKIVVGVMTGSLGILAEAAHSGLDLVAAVMTFFAVRISGRPADRNHNYGHGKVENLSALFETLLLVVTSAWVILEAVHRLSGEEVRVEVNIWSFVVMGASIVINISRGQLLARVAKKYNSQALEADALHFMTDVWSSIVVILGLGMISLADRYHLAWMRNSDSVAAIIVAGIIVYASYSLGRSAIGELLDEVPDKLQDQVIQMARQVKGVEKVEMARLHRSGTDYYVDMTVSVNRSDTLEQAHAVAEIVEKAVQSMLPGAFVLVHVNPVRIEDEPMFTGIKAAASRFGLGVHNIRIHELQGKKILSVHLDLEQGHTIESAHQSSLELEEVIGKMYPEIDEVWVHVEPVVRYTISKVSSVLSSDVSVEALIDRLPALCGVDCNVHHVVLLDKKDSLDIYFHLALSPEMSVEDAHELTENMESILRSKISRLEYVVIQTEPDHDIPETPSNKIPSVT